MISLELLLASAIGLLTATGIYLILRARTFPVVLGLGHDWLCRQFIFICHGANSLMRLRYSRKPAKSLTHLPQALVLTAIVIGFATTAFIVQLALRSRYETGTRPR